jgi:ATP diphosphatase
VSGSGIERLLEVMRRLRDPESGCPWDLEQSFATIAPYTIEEAYEVADAIERGDMADLEGELGDLLLQVVYHAQMASERRLFDFDRLAHAIADKMIRRHPHVFGGASVASADAQSRAWEQQKAGERAARAADGADPSVLADIPAVLPALTRAMKLQRRAARVGFDWPAAAPVLGKVREELAEIEQALALGDEAAVRAEVGDLLFALVNLARHLDADPEAALRASNARFERRFRRIERRLRAQGRAPQDASLDELDELWEEAKRAERDGREACGSAPNPPGLPSRVRS